MEHPPKQGLKLHTATLAFLSKYKDLMEHPPKQGLKQQMEVVMDANEIDLMEHPPKQGLKLFSFYLDLQRKLRFNGTSTKTRIETETIAFFRKAST